MKNFARRSFLRFLPSAVAGIAVTPLLKCASSTVAAPELEPPDTAATCWMDVCAPFVVRSTAAGIRSRVILTSDSFFGRNGHADGRDSTEYEIYVYDAGGQPYGPNGLTRHLIVPAMQTTILDLSELVPERKISGVECAFACVPAGGPRCTPAIFSAPRSFAGNPMNRSPTCTRTRTRYTGKNPIVSFTQCPSRHSRNTLASSACLIRMRSEAPEH